MNGIEFYKYIKNFPIEGVYSTVECLLAEERVPFSKLCKKIDDEDEDRINYIVDNLELLQALRNKYGNYIDVEGENVFRSFNYYEQESLCRWDDSIEKFLDELITR